MATLELAPERTRRMHVAYWQHTQQLADKRISSLAAWLNGVAGEDLLDDLDTGITIIEEEANRKFAMAALSIIAKPWELLNNGTGEYPSFECPVCDKEQPYEDGSGDCQACTACCTCDDDGYCTPY
jgi:hypothetical protein